MFDFSGGPVSEDINAGATGNLIIKLHGIVISDFDFDFCSGLGIDCPVKKGRGFEGRATYTEPYPFPPGNTIEYVASFKNADGTEVDCYTIDIPTIDLVGNSSKL